MNPLKYEELLFTPSQYCSIAERSKLKPYQQGQLDGYCGVYSVVNAVHYLCGPLTSTQAEALLLKVMKFLEGSQPAVRRLSNGTILKEILKVIDHIIIRRYPICRLKPFHHNKNVSLDMLWSDMSAFLSAHNGIVIFCLDGKYDHWSLVKKVTDTSLLLFDSDKLHRLPKRYCTTDKDDEDLHILYPTHILYLWTDSRSGGSNE